MRLMKMVPIMYNLHLLSYVILIVLPWTRSELFTAIAEVEPLLETHQRIIDDLDHYVSLEEKRLLHLKKTLNLYKKEHEKAMEDIPNYLGNPINAFTLIKRLTTDLDAIEQSIKSGTEYIKNVTINHKDVKYPAAEDLSGAAHALIRLQETYRLNVKDLAEGMLNGVVYSTPMTTSDCFELARALYSDKDYKNALPWFLETLRKYKTDSEGIYNFDEVDILEYIGFSHYLSGDVRGALHWTKRLLEIEPNHPRALGNVPHYEKSIKEEEAKIKKRQRGETLEEEEKTDKDYNQYGADDRKWYEKLCRGEVELPAAYSKRLICRYMTEHHPFLKLAPIKMEYLYLKPDVILFHEVLSDDEIKFLQMEAKSRLKRAVVHDPKTGQLVEASYRISKSAWLRDEEAPAVATVSQRVADMTGLSMASAEDLQVVNYGIGGHYEPHFDFARKFEKAFERFSGNRIATVLFYMSEVAQGGATVFTRLGLSVFPRKGAALYWLNLHPSGQGDISTRHAACPVLRGSKWVCNKWIHEGGQEFIKPCNLNFQDESFLHKLPKPISKTSR
ncbi:prolyl 4-hydroxylase subunit alpha-1 [Amyelois transitella]|uniref:prolyl 4-hydroxylase subunit alpha-1 n=1 Tax=Amyelois transitella TaxID=680683 RepID=UPI00067B9647|nr:prolyl 4-hydroxylase subunit alpha-1 [Amyelois transitella]XP_013187302.1 prolyl 4-hydroxylase subunit alpha-1 [Amyelois transitella]XP_013187303.1 prolyl 4-hydroxylase subunit alpha-1 [Amyelois transitella]